jgi:predicted phage baseplate assembly protein
VPLPAPNLDDRRFQQLVDEAKRFIQQRCPEWTDHNVSDPGVTLIEAFAHMVDQLLYRLNRVPDKSYLAFLDLIGVRLFPPSAARAQVTFWLSAPQPQPVLLRAETEVATVRTESDEAVVFSTARDLAVVPCELAHLVTQQVDQRPVEKTEELLDTQDVRCFGAEPRPGDAMLLGLSAAVPACAVALQLDSRVEGIGVDPRQPPLAWEAWDGADWASCDVDHDTTGGLNRPGEVVLHVPGAHAMSVVAGRRAGWLRCRVVAPAAGQPFYSESPTVRGASAFTIGGTTEALHAETVRDETLGESEGVPGQRFLLSRAPVVPDGEPFVVAVSSAAGWEEWTEVDHFAGSGPDDRHVCLDRTSGEVSFGPAVREPDGTLRRNGAVPGKGAHVRVPKYRTGGGARGNVARGAISVLRSSVPYVAQVENREAAAGGVDGETVESARRRGPVQLRAQDRAVTAADFEEIAREAAPSAARIRCVPADAAGEAGGVRVLVVPDVVADDAAAGERLRIEQLVPPEEMLAAIARRLDERRPIGTRLAVEPPYYQGVTVVARLVARAGVAGERLRAEALATLYRYFNPVREGPAGAGWPFGRTAQVGEVYAALQRLPGVELVDDVRLYPADPLTGRRGEPVASVEIEESALVFSYEHQIRVDEPGA